MADAIAPAPMNPMVRLAGNLRAEGEDMLQLREGGANAASDERGRKESSVGTGKQAERLSK